MSDSGRNEFEGGGGKNYFSFRKKKLLASKSLRKEEGAAGREGRKTTASRVLWGKRAGFFTKKGEPVPHQQRKNRPEGEEEGVEEKRSTVNFTTSKKKGLQPGYGRR